MQTLSYADFSLRVHRRVTTERIPVGGTVEVTRRCPLKCVHCYNRLPLDDGVARDRELTRDEHIRILDEAAAAGCFWLLFTGGEVFARPDFLDIYRYAKQKGFLITVFTNGFFIDERIADQLADWKPFSIELTLYGRSRETHEGVTRVAGSHERCLRAIRLFTERELPLKLKAMALTSNRHELSGLKRLAEEDLGLEFRFDGLLNPGIDDALDPLPMRLDPVEIVALDLEDRKRTQKLKLFADEFCGPGQPPAGSQKLFRCGGGQHAFAVDPYGGLSLCLLGRNHAYDLRAGTFTEGWEDFLGAERRRTVSRPGKCVTCSIRALCGMCPANGELENGDPEEPVDFLCRIAHLRALCFGHGVTDHGDCEYCPGGSRHAELTRTASHLLANARTN